MKAKGKQGKPQNWENVPIDQEFLASDKEFSNLISFEVLTDYTVTKEADKKDKPKLLKRKDEHSNGSSDDSEEDTATVTSTKSAAVAKVKLQKKNSKKKVKLEDRPTDDESGTENETPNTSSISVCSTSSWEVMEIDPRQESEVLPSKRTKKNLKKKKKQILKTTQVKPFREDEPQEEPEDFDATSWSRLGVPDIILQALKESSFVKPTPIQDLTLPASILGRKDVVGAAETGSGKTLAFGIPIISGILADQNKGRSDGEEDENADGVQSLILTPTRELAVQIKRHIEAISKNHTSIRVMVIVGGLSAQKQERILRCKPEIVIATPGRLWELIQEGNDHLSTLSKIRYLAVDETDRMVEKGHFQELQGILEVLNSNQEAKAIRQNFVFSATLAFTHEPPKRFKKPGSKSSKNLKTAKKVSPQQKLKEIMEMIGVRENAKIVDITSGKGTCETLSEMSISCQLNQKDYYLYYFLICHPGRTIVFCNSINCVRRLVNLFFLLKCEAFPLHSEMNQKQRLRNLERFTANDKAVLIATDVAARGLDITNIQHVIHYQIPKTAESYIHRSGRTARAFKGGIAIAMIEPAETTSFWNISRSLGRTEMLPSFQVDSELYNEIKARVNMAIKVEKIEHSVRKELADMNWAEKTRKDLDLASSDEGSDEDNDGPGSQNSKKSLLQKKKELEGLKQRLSQMIDASTMLQKKFVNVQTTLTNMAPTPISSK